MKKKRLVLLLMIISVISLTACATAAVTDENGTSDDSETIKIAYLPITHSLSILETAKEMENDNGLNIELVKYGSWPELMDALNTGNVDGASVLIELAMKSKEQGIGVKAVALGHRDGNVIITSKEINTIQDLKGKTFAIPHRQSSHNLLLNDLLSQAGLTKEDLTITELAPTEMPSALASGQIDGYCVAEPFGAMAVALNYGKVLKTSEEIWENSVCCSLVLTDKFINEHNDTAKKFVDSYKETGERLTTQKAKETAKQYFNQNEEVIDISLQWISFHELEITEEIYNGLVDRVKKYGLSENPPLYKDFVDNTL